MCLSFDMTKKLSHTAKGVLLIVIPLIGFTLSTIVQVLIMRFVVGETYDETSVIIFLVILLYLLPFLFLLSMLVCVPMAIYFFVRKS